jgi:4-hydroxy-tetrahydrodipicolinate synthase
MIPQALEIGGIHPVLYSFFDEQGQVRFEGFEHQVEHCIQSGASGVILFGFVTQFYRLTFDEKRDIARLVARQLAGRAKLGITIMEPSLDAQIAQVRLAEEIGADWVILQPPLGPSSRAEDWADLIRQIAENTGLPVAIQNAKVANTQLETDRLLALAESCPNIALCKAETEIDDVAIFARHCGDVFRVICGDWGVEYPLLRTVGAHGLIPAPNFVAEQVAIHQLTSEKLRDLRQADELHRSILPLMQFIRERSAPEGQIQLGKYVYQRKTGFTGEGYRSPSPSALCDLFKRHADRLCDQLWGV